MIPVEGLWALRERYLRNRWTGSDCFLIEGTVTPYGKWVGNWLTLIEKEIVRRNGMSEASRISTVFSEPQVSGFEQWRRKIMENTK